MITHTVQVFRHRGFQPAAPDAEVIMVFGDEPAPQNPDGTAMKVLWDHDHVQHTTVQNHVAASATVDAGTVADPAAH